jgi:CHAT domain-containing protein/tetratricopeptide (TPR) repeat protein
VVADFSTDMTEESNSLESRESSKPEWQRKLARRIAEGAQGRPMYIWPWLAGAAAVLAAAGAGWLAWNQWMAGDPARLIARAYTEQRPFEYRIPGAGYAAVRQERGVKSSFERPLELNEAVSKIGGELQKNPEAVKWMELRARAEMLERDPEAAIATLQHALERKPDDPDLLAELGMGYALRAESRSDRAVDYGYAIDYFERARRAKPNPHETVFNLAVAYEQMNSVEEAIGEWRQYLTLDASGPWHEEAQRRLSGLEQKERVRQAALERISDKNPDRLLQSIDKGEVVEPEEYLNVVVTEWLPRRWEAAKYERVLSALAERFVEQHNDPWLRDVLAANRSGGMIRGLVALAAAVEANSADETDRALNTSIQAAHDFRAAGSEAAALRAELEYSYALHREDKSQAACVAKADTVERSASLRTYAWIAARARLEQGNCRSLIGDSGRAYSDMTQALEEARHAGYSRLEFQIDCILAEMRADNGNLAAVWDFGSKGLARYWGGSYPANRAHQIYVNLETVVENLGLHQAAFMMQRAATKAIGETPALRVKAVNSTYLARLAVEAGRDSDAQTEFEQADRLFDRLPQAKGDVVRILAVVDHAEAESAAGHTEGALKLLAGIRTAAEASDARVESGFQEALGDSLWRTGKMDRAEAAYRRAIDLTERSLATRGGTRERAEWLIARGKAYRGVAELLWDRGDPAAALRIWEWYRAGERPGKRRELDLDTRRAQLRNESFLTYAALPGGIVAWLFDDRGVEGKRLGIQTAMLDVVAQRFLRECADPASDRQALKQDGRQLYDWLVRPLIHRIDPARTLVIETDGVLAAIPMQALTDENSGYLGEWLAVTASSGLADYQFRAAAGRVSAGAQALVVAGPNLGDEMTRAFPPLEGVVEESESIAARFQKHVLLKGDAATLGAIDRHRAGAELLHFAGHGFSNAGNGGLLLSPERGSSQAAGVLDGGTLSQQNWSRCRLAVLSACSAGTGEATGVNPESLVRGLLWAGVARVVASRWNMDTHTGALFMGQFYTHLLAGEDAARALQQAARSIRGKQETRHPYYWAGFENFGTR